MNICIVSSFLVIRCRKGEMISVIVSPLHYNTQQTRVVQSLFQQYDRSPSRVVVNKNQVSRSEDEAKKEVAATIEDEDEEDKEIMEVLGAEEVDTELDYEVDSEMTTIRECSQKMKCI